MLHQLVNKGHDGIDKLRQKLSVPADAKYEGKLVKASVKKKVHRFGKRKGNDYSINIKIGK